MPPPAPLLGFVRARMELLRLNLASKASIDSPEYMKLSQESLQAVLTQIKAVGKLNVDTVTQIMKMCEEHNVWRDEHMTELRQHLGLDDLFKVVDPKVKAAMTWLGELRDGAPWG